MCASRRRQLTQLGPSSEMLRQQVPVGEVVRPVGRVARQPDPAADVAPPAPLQAADDLDNLFANALVPPDDALSYSNQAIVMNPDDTLEYFNHSTYDEVLASEPAEREPQRG